MAKPSSAAFLVLLLVVMNSAMPALASRADVNIFNQVGGTIRLHCKSGDDDLGERTLLNGQKFGWGFNYNIWGSTLFYCGFSWGAKTQNFNVWNDSGFSGTRIQGCQWCEWTVRPEGFYMAESGKTPVLMHPWQ